MAVLELAEHVYAPDQTDCEDQERRRQHVQVLHEGLPGVVDHRPLVGRCDQVAHPGVDQAGAGDSQVPLFTQKKPAAGVYLFRLRIEDPETGRLRDSLTGKMTLLR